LALVLVVALFASLAVGCGKTESGKKTIAVIAKGETHAFWQAVKAGAVDAGKAAGYEVTFRGPTAESEEYVGSQREMVQAALNNSSVKGIVLENVVFCNIDGTMGDEGNCYYYRVSNGKKAGWAGGGALAVRAKDLDSGASRGYVDGLTVTNCTFRNNAKCGVAIIYEIYWGESGMSENLKIERNLFDNTSYSDADQVRYQHAPLIIMGLGGGRVEEDYLLYKNIDIIGNKFINRNVHVNPYAIYLQAVRDVVIEGNDFGTFEGESEDNFAGAIGFNGAMNIKIENNTYSEYVALEQNFFGGFYKNVYGADVDGVIPKDKDD
jgi:hypothetical protein